MRRHSWLKTAPASSPPVTLAAIDNGTYNALVVLSWSRPSRWIDASPDGPRVGGAAGLSAAAPVLRQTAQPCPDTQKPHNRCVGGESDQMRGEAGYAHDQRHYADDSD
jgi:hypothetical protein